MRALVVIALIGCSNPKPAFECEGNVSCRDGANQGSCEETGYCSFPDMACPLGSRYGKAAGDGLADTCVEVVSPLGAWKADMALPSPRYTLGAAVGADSTIYIAGGIQGSEAKSDVFLGTSSEFGGIKAWTAGPAFPEARRNYALVAADGFLYAIGGRTPSNPSDGSVLAAPIMAGGALGAWTPTNPMPGALRSHTAVTYGQNVYVAGGKSGSNAGGKDVIVGNLSNGEVTWHPGSLLNHQRFSHASVVVGNHLYVIGGCSAGNNGCPDILASVEMAEIDEKDGTLGPFTEVEPLPVGRWHHTAAANGNHIVVVGGDAVGETKTKVTYWTHVNSDGSLGKWRVGTPLATAGQRKSALVVGEFVFVIAGETQVASFK